MSSKAHSLLKRLRTKKHEEEEKEERERPKSEEKRTENIKTLNLGAIRDNKTDLENQRTKLTELLDQKIKEVKDKESEKEK